jgi:hypothetical protein
VVEIKKMVSSGKLVCVLLFTIGVFYFYLLSFVLKQVKYLNQHSAITGDKTKIGKIIFTAIQTIKESKENSNQHSAITASKIAITIQTLF